MTVYMKCVTVCLGALLCAVPLVAGASQSINWTFYGPGAAGKMQGGMSAAAKGPDGSNVIRTLDDVRTGKSKFVTLASAKSMMGKWFCIGTVTYTSPTTGPGDGKTHTLENVVGYVHDTGCAFNGTCSSGWLPQYSSGRQRVDKMDIPVGNFTGWGAGPTMTYITKNKNSASKTWQQIAGPPTGKITGTGSACGGEPRESGPSMAATYKPKDITDALEQQRLFQQYQIPPALQNQQPPPPPPMQQLPPLTVPQQQPGAQTSSLPPQISPPVETQYPNYQSPDAGGVNSRTDVTTQTVPPVTQISPVSSVLTPTPYSTLVKTAFVSPTSTLSQVLERTKNAAPVFSMPERLQEQARPRSEQKLILPPQPVKVPKVTAVRVSQTSLRPDVPARALLDTETSENVSDAAPAQTNISLKVLSTFVTDDLARSDVRPPAPVKLTNATALERLRGILDRIAGLLRTIISSGIR